MSFIPQIFKVMIFYKVEKLNASTNLNHFLAFEKKHKTHIFFLRLQSA